MPKHLSRALLHAAVHSKEKHFQLYCQLNIENAPALPFARTTFQLLQQRIQQANESEGRITAYRLLRNRPL